MSGPRLTNPTRSAPRHGRTRMRVAWLAPAVACLAIGCGTLGAARLYATGTAALEEGETSRAIADLERAVALAPDASEIQNHLGLAYQDAGRHPDALRAFERAVELNCENAAAQENLSAARGRMGSAR